MINVELTLSFWLPIGEWFTERIASQRKGGYGLATRSSRLKAFT
jgi:hypothetical protein